MFCVSTFSRRHPRAAAHASAARKSAAPTPVPRTSGATRMSQSTAGSRRPSSIVTPGVSHATAAPPTSRPSIRAPRNPQWERSNRSRQRAGPPSSAS
ncbi:MAG TPA: hypothetical protein VFT45_16355 [Longimicrobium sp.]|nr:hypothetical protein [Longimicrobium sp.]